MTTKAQERKALELIRRTIEAMGEDSYIGAAFEGCLELAEQNITDDTMYSMSERWQTAQAELKTIKAKLAKAEAERDALAKELERAEGWREYEDPHNAKQSFYAELERDISLGCAHEMSDSEARELIAKEFGFALERIVIVHEVARLEISCQRRTRVNGSYNRKAIFAAWDYNYIRFNIIGHGTPRAYEMINGEFHAFCW